MNLNTPQFYTYTRHSKEKMETQQMLEHLLAGQEQILADSKAWREKMAKTEAIRAETEAI
jgi:hypothetical protein